MADCATLIHDLECSVVKQRVAVAVVTKTGRCADPNQDPRTKKSPKVSGRAWGGEAPQEFHQTPSTHGST